jgi:glycine/D-amino acid oxidase-like deaminating enzyme
MLDVVIVGAGYLGKAIARMLQDAGHDVAVVDDGNKLSGTRNASGYVDPSWFKGEDREWVERGLDWLKHQDVGLRRVGLKATLSERKAFMALNGSAPDFEFKRESGWLMLDPWKFQIPDVKLVEERALGLESHSDRAVVVTERGLIEGRKVVVAAGFRADSLLRTIPMSKTLGVSPLWGGWTYAKNKFDGLRLIQRTPYSYVAVRDWQGGMRVGDSTGRTAPEAVDRAVEFFNLATHFMRMKVEEEVAIRVGARAYRSAGITTERVAPGVIASSGGGKVTASLMFREACKAKRLIEDDRRL